MDLNRLNSATKYPSILTYHRLGERGVPTDDVQVHFVEGTPLIFTEKIDGVNARLIFIFNGEPDWLIGSREEMLTAHGDRVPNPAMGIVDALRPIADRNRLMATDSLISVCYFEVFGGKTTRNAKEYTSDPKIFGVRLFDIAIIDASILKRSIEEIASWRDSGGQTFLTESKLEHAAREFGVELTPRLHTSDPLPTDPAHVRSFLEKIAPRSCATLDSKANGQPEGVVVRTADRSQIAKIRFEDYAKLRKPR
jgi:hypothetical protein